MIRFLRIFSIIGCLMALLVYGGVSIYTENQTDKNGPQISMEEKEITVSTQDGQEAVLSGVTAIDKKDGEVTDLLVVESLSNFIEKGCREASIAAFDKDGNVTKNVRKVIYSDYTSPRVSLSGPLKVQINNSEALMDKISVMDCLDGDITSNVQITSEETVSSSQPGEYRMHLQVSNSAGDVVDLPVTVEYYSSAMGNTTPQILLNEYLVYAKTGSPLNPLDYVKGIILRGQEYIWGSDNPPEIGKESIRVDSQVDYYTPGTYEICYAIQEENGTQGKVRLVVVVEE
ncbi:DUF5011 domain-containing protein [bacterium]|nr:DUF5011 domain-containing protein [bacterium]MDY3023054.1 hypothetical protein [Oliverpabstia sp.]